MGPSTTTSAEDIVLPSRDEAVATLGTLDVPDEDVDDILAGLDSVRRSDDLQAQLWKTMLPLLASMDRDGPAPRVAAPLRAGKAPARRYVAVLVCLALLPHVRALHHRMGVPEDVSRLTLAELWRQVAIYRWRHDGGGLRDLHWLARVFTGRVLQLGRLQFERTTLPAEVAADIVRAGQSARSDEPWLAVHIPEYCGPLTPGACDDAFDRARAFYAGHVPQHYRYAVCSSWLLDTQWTEYLTEDANIVTFQRRFTIRTHPANDASILRFIFGSSSTDLDRLPRDTTLQRAAIDHIKVGGHWRAGTGWVAL